MGLAFASFVLLAALQTMQTPAPENPIALPVASRYFAEAAAISRADNRELWGVPLCGPMLFVDPASRTVMANRADEQGNLRADGDIFVGKLPEDSTVANTTLDWAGVSWTEMMWPLPNDARKRTALIAHECFHTAQKPLGLPRESPAIAHLDSAEGRTLLQLEWRALAAALESNGAKQRRHIADALVFRSARHATFPEGARNEIQLELNEGLAEYTGARMSGSSRPEQVQYALADLNNTAKLETFVRSFAYASGPAYGLLLDSALPAWRAQMRDKPQDMAAMLERAMSISPPQDVKLAAEARADAYDGPSLRTAEAQREQTRRKREAELRAAFVDGPVVRVPLRKMQIQFNPNNVQPLGGLGTVYPDLRISDEWGVLDAPHGGLVSPEWNQVTVPACLLKPGPPIEGEGWTLRLNSGWTLEPGARKGDQQVVSGTAEKAQQ